MNEIKELNIELKEFLEENRLELLNTDTLKSLTWKSQLNLKCLVCGNEFSISIKQLLRPHPERSDDVCPRCSSEKRFHRKLKEKYGRIPYEFLSPFISYDDNIRVRCKDCGSEWEGTVKSLLMNSKLKGTTHPCKTCAKNRRSGTKSISTLEEKLIEKFGECNYEFPYPEEYSGIFSKEKMHIKCKLCGHEMFTTISNILNPTNGKHYCRVCNKKDRTLEYMSYKERCLKITDGKVEPIEDYIDSKTPIKHKCNVCGYGTKGEWLKIPVKNTQRNAGCPVCANLSVVSKAEDEIAEFIQSLDSSLKIERNSRKVLPTGKELDIYIPEKKVAIEYNGLYWHSEKYKGKKYHLEKLEACEKDGIRLLQIFEDEWEYKRDIVKSKIKNILGYNTTDIVYARKCTVEDIDPTQKNAFLDKYHIQGGDRAAIKKCLKYNGEVVAVMTFCKSRAALGQKGEKYELSRFAASKHVVGGFSKLFKHIINEFNISDVITYADLRWSSKTSNVYDKNGFKLLHSSNPNYWYFDKNKTPSKREHRFNYRKQLLDKKFPAIYKPELTEFEIMDQTQYRRIWDCGNLVYEWKREDNE